MKTAQTLLPNQEQQVDNDDAWGDDGAAAAAAETARARAPRAFSPATRPALPSCHAGDSFEGLGLSEVVLRGIAALLSGPRPCSWPRSRRTAPAATWWQGAGGVGQDPCLRSARPLGGGLGRERSQGADPGPDGEPCEAAVQRGRAPPSPAHGRGSPASWRGTASTPGR